MVFVGKFQVESYLYSLESVWLKNNNKLSPFSHTLSHAIIRHMSNFPWVLSQHILQPILPLDVSKLPSLCMFTDAVVSVIRVHLTPAIHRLEEAYCDAPRVSCSHPVFICSDSWSCASMSLKMTFTFCIQEVSDRLMQRAVFFFLFYLKVNLAEEEL